MRWNTVGLTRPMTLDLGDITHSNEIQIGFLDAEAIGMVMPATDAGGGLDRGVVPSLTQQATNALNGARKGHQTLCSIKSR